MAKRKFIRDVKSGRFVKQSDNNEALKTTAIEYIDNRKPKAGVKSWHGPKVYYENIENSNDSTS